MMSLSEWVLESLPRAGSIHVLFLGPGLRTGVVSVDRLEKSTLSTYNATYRQASRM
jgi:hypothetical protein